MSDKPTLSTPLTRLLEWLSDRDNRRLGIVGGGSFGFRWPWSRLSSVRHLQDAALGE